MIQVYNKRKYFLGAEEMSESNFEPILLDFPESFESERLIIRALQWGDGKLISEAIEESYDALQPWMPWLKKGTTVEEQEINSRKARIHFLERKDLRLVLIHKETGELIGCSGLHRLNWEVRQFEIGYWLRTSYEKQGYITEAVHAITEFAIKHLDANRLEICCDSRNEKSANVARRCGFTLEGILRNDSMDVKGELASTMLFTKVRGYEF